MPGLNKPEVQLLSPNGKDTSSSLVRILAAVFAVTITVGLAAVYLSFRKRHAVETIRQTALESPPKPAIVPSVAQVYLDDAMTKGSETLIGGTIQNISKNPLSGVAVELELKHRKGGSPEITTVRVNPADLRPDQEGRYSLTVSAQEYSSARLVRLKQEGSNQDIPFKTSAGARWPPERTPQVGPTVYVKRPSARRGGEEFINTPDTPAKIP